MFRIKNRDRHFSDTRTTLDAKHQKTIKQLHTQHKDIPKKNRKLTQLYKQLNTINKELENTFDYSDIISSRIRKQQLIKDIKDTEQEIDDISKNKYATDYLMRTSDILNKYTHNNVDKAKLLDQYLIATNQKSPNIIQYQPKCPNCNIDLVIDTAHRLCIQCGFASDEIMLPEKPSYRDGQQTEIITKFSYKRLNHFRDWMKLCQGKEFTDIPQYVYDSVLAEMRKHRMSKKDLTRDKLREFLRKLKLSGYCEHAAYILKQLTGKEPPVIDKDLEEQFIIMFMETQEPFQRHKPTDRKNYLSYSYVLHKFCELLERDDLTPEFELLKDRGKLYEQDKMWENICRDLGWEYIPSV